MKTAIFYFTGTGNSLFAAKQLKEELGGDIELISISKALKENRRNFSYDRIGFSYPLYMMNLPVIVEEFISGSEFNGVKYCFSITTAGVTPGVSNSLLNELLKTKNLYLNNYKWIYFTSNYIRRFNMPNEKTKQKKDVSAKRMIKDFAREINGEKSITIPKMSILKLISNKPYSDWKRDLHTAAAGFSVDDKCALCKTCIKVCPVENISITESRVKWGSKCQDCMACIQLCPKQSIQLRGVTENRGRYINPNITLNEIITSNS